MGAAVLGGRQLASEHRPCEGSTLLTPQCRAAHAAPGQSPPPPPAVRAFPRHPTSSAPRQCEPSHAVPHSANYLPPCEPSHAILPCPPPPPPPAMQAIPRRVPPGSASRLTPPHAQRPQDLRTAAPSPPPPSPPPRPARLGDCAAAAAAAAARGSESPTGAAPARFLGTRLLT